MTARDEIAGEISKKITSHGAEMKDRHACMIQVGD
jgi:hypothetical protein